MSSILQELLTLPASVLEFGLTTMGGGMRALQTTFEGLSGQGSGSGWKQPPVNGPRDLDSALADFANQMIRLGRLTRPGAADVIRTLREAASSARRSFGYIDPRDPRAIALSLAMPLSAGGMMAEALLRGIVFLSALGPKRFTTSVLDFIEQVSDVGPFVSLQYKDLIDRYVDRLEREPEDAGARLELGRVYIKCGRYSDAVRELKIAARNPSTRAIAIHESSVAQYRQGKFRAAVDDAVAAMNARPDNDRARLWLWLSAQKLGGYPPNVPGSFRMELKAGIAPTTLRYENIAARIGLNKTSGGRGSAIFDYNNDGLLDVVITSAHGGSNLYRNNGDGTFTDVSVGSGLDECVNGFSIIAGDYDNDGFTDLFVSRLGWYSGIGSLYHNNGDGTFTDVTEAAGLEIWGPSFTASWVDYDCDGYLDLFVPNNVGGVFDRHVPNRLFHNNGDGTFTEVTEKAGVAGLFPAIGCAWGDYNNDGYPDLFLSGLGHACILRNNGDGTFTDVSLKAGLTHPAVGSICAWCDYDNDGWLDIVQFTWSEHEDMVHTMKTGCAPEDGLPMRIYHNNRDSTFTKRDRDIGLDGCWGTMSGACGDLDNDGNLDFMLGNGSPRMDRLEPMVVLQSDGINYRNVTFSSGLPFASKSHGVNCADLFGDGRLSIVVAAGGAYPGDLLSSVVFCPVERLGNYVNVRLTGTKSNRDAIGARVTLIAGKSQQMREVGGGTNFGCLPAEQHFGLGDRTDPLALEIRWPSGLVQRVENVPVNSTVRITENAAGFELVNFDRLARQGTPYGNHHKNDHADRILSVRHTG
jgi:tetratricopeptide (TPR) repeat protein